MLDILINSLLQALTFGIAAIGVAIAFRVIRYPDLTADGSFMLGSTMFVCTASVTGNWIAPLALSVFAGASAGVVTALLNTWFGVSRLLSGILTTMIAYSLAFRLLGGRSNVGLAAETTMFYPPPALMLEGASSVFFVLAVATVFAVAVALGVRQLLRSELGLLLRATGGNPGLVIDLGRSPRVYGVIGLAVANGLIALGGVLVSAQQGFVDINLGVGMVVTLVAALVLGEELFNRLGGEHRASFAKRAAAPVVGAAVYFLLHLVILRLSILGWIPVSVQPTDLKLLSAALLIVVIALRRDRPSREEMLPL